MKLKTKTIVFVLLTVLAVAIGWWLSNSRMPSQSIVVSAKPAPAAAKASPQPMPKPDDLPKIVQPYARTPMLNLADPRWKGYEAKRKLDPSSEWRTPIEFFGKVVDEKEQPVAGALIEFAWTGTPEKYGGDGVGKRTLTSDSNGMFSLTGVGGKGMTVYVSKEGYYRRSESNGWFEYAGFWEPTFI